MNKKNKSLIFSISLIFFCIGVIQILLYRGTTDSLVSHCREINRQNISLYNLLSGIPLFPSTSFEKKTQEPTYCNKFMSKETRKYVDELNLYKTNDFSELLDVSGERIRLLSDNYQQLEKKRALDITNFLMFIILFNIFGLLLILPFIKVDKK